MKKISPQLIKQYLNSVFEKNDLNGIIGSDGIRNINIFSHEVVIDLSILNPTLQAKKKKLESLIETAVLKNFQNFSKVVVNFFVVKEEKAPLIKGKAIKNIKNIVAVASGKGGVGKSTVTANLSISLAKMGFSVGVLDADIYGPSIPMMFDVLNEKPKSKNINGVSKMIPISSYGVKLLSIGFFTKIDQAVIWRGPMASKALNQMIFDCHWDELDFLLIDLPPGTGDIHLSIMQALPISGAVVVSTPQPVALADAKKAVAMFEQENIKVPVLGIIENMSFFTPDELPKNKYYIFGREGAKNLATDLKVPFLGEIPIYQSIREAGDIGRPASMQQKTMISNLLLEITKNVVYELVKRNKELPKTEIIKITTMAGCSAVNNK
jgi:ATP-binding protein involved in chromosome partitioning